MSAGPLGRRAPADYEHVDRYRLTAAPTAPTHVPVVLGIDWHEAFDRPEQKGKRAPWWIGRGELGSVRGGHAVCLEPGRVDRPKFYAAYDQEHEGACVGFASARMVSLLNSTRYKPRLYAARELWVAARLADTDPSNDNLADADQGTTVRAAMDVLRTRGPILFGGPGPVAEEGISANRWATSADEVLAALGTPELDYVVVLNSWGKSYPHRVRMPAEVLERLLANGGEAAVVTDR